MLNKILETLFNCWIYIFILTWICSRAGWLHFLAESVAEPFGWTWNQAKPEMSQKVKSNFLFGLSHFSVWTFDSAWAEPFGSVQSSEFRTEPKLRPNEEFESELTGLVHLVLHGRDSLIL